jgi:hypothetical protein
MVSSAGQDTSVLNGASYTLRATSFTDTQNRFPSVPAPASSRADFIQALRIMGRERAGDRCQFELHGQVNEAVQTAFLRCPLTTWLAVFGPPEDVHEHGESAPTFPVHVWKYQCTDGPIYCVGFQVDELNGTRWVTFVRVCYF